MTSETGGRRPRRPDGLIGAVEEFAVGVGRLGYGLLSLGLDLLPRQSRQHMHNAVHELSHAFASLPRDFAELAEPEIERWAAEGDAGVTAAHVHAAPATAAVRTAHGEAGVQRIVVTREEAASVALAPANVAIAHIEYDPPGRDREGEYVLLRNDAPHSVDLTGWTLRDGGGRHSFVFPGFQLAPGGTVTIWTRPGLNDTANLYWGSTGAIWNNEGDSATLSDAAGSVIARYAYTGAG